MNFYLERWEKVMILRQANAAYDAMRKDEKECEEELELWDVTLMDGLEEDE